MLPDKNHVYITFTPFPMFGSVGLFVISRINILQTLMQAVTYYNAADSAAPVMASSQKQRQSYLPEEMACASLRGTSSVRLPPSSHSHWLLSFAGLVLPCAGTEMEQHLCSYLSRQMQGCRVFSRVMGWCSGFYRPAWMKTTIHHVKNSLSVRKY